MLSQLLRNDLQGYLLSFLPHNALFMKFLTIEPCMFNIQPLMKGEILVIKEKDYLPGELSAVQKKLTSANHKTDVANDDPETG